MIDYIFDIFTKYKPLILKEQLLQVVNIFMDQAANGNILNDL